MGAGQWLYARRFAPITNATLQCIGLALVWHALNTASPNNDLSAYHEASWSMQPFGHDRHGPKNWRGLLCPFGWVELAHQIHISHPLLHTISEVSANVKPVTSLLLTYLTLPYGWVGISHPVLRPQQDRPNLHHQNNCKVMWTSLRLVTVTNSAYFMQQKHDRRLRTIRSCGTNWAATVYVVTGQRCCRDISDHLPTSATFDSQRQLQSRIYNLATVAKRIVG